MYIRDEAGGLYSVTPPSFAISYKCVTLKKEDADDRIFVMFNVKHLTSAAVVLEGFTAITYIPLYLQSNWGSLQTPTQWDLIDGIYQMPKKMKDKTKLDIEAKAKYDETLITAIITVYELQKGTFVVSDAYHESLIAVAEQDTVSATKRKPTTTEVVFEAV